MQDTLRVLDIVPGTSVDGPGLRTSIYFAGCSHHCPGCHNPQSWDFQAGQAMTATQILKEIELNGFNVTFSGGDPLMQPLDALYRLARGIKELDLTIWCYTGYTYEHISTDTQFAGILSLMDVLVDGPFIESLRDTSLHFRGSSNQRLIDLKSSSASHINFWQH